MYSYIYQLASASSQQQLDKYHTTQSNQPHSYNGSLTQKHVIPSRGNQQQLQAGNGFFLLTLSCDNYICIDIHLCTDIDNSIV